MVAEAPRFITYTFPGREKSIVVEKTRIQRKSFMEYGPIAGKPGSSEFNWVPIDWAAWKLLVEVLGISPEKLK